MTPLDAVIATAATGHQGTNAGLPFAAPKSLRVFGSALHLRYFDACYPVDVSSCALGNPLQHVLPMMVSE